MISDPTSPDLFSNTPEGLFLYKLGEVDSCLSPEHWHKVNVNCPSLFLNLVQQFHSLFDIRPTPSRQIFM